MLNYIAALYVVDWSQCNHINVILTSVFICVPANQLPLSHTLPTELSKGSRVFEGGRSFSHQSPSDWQFNLIHRFHLLCFTSSNTDNTHRCPLHIYVRVFVHVCVCEGTCVCVCFHFLVSLKLPLRGFVLLGANPLVNLLSAVSQTLRSGGKKGEWVWLTPIDIQP